MRNTGDCKQSIAIDDQLYKEEETKTAGSKTSEEIMLKKTQLEILWLEKLLRRVNYVCDKLKWSEKYSEIEKYNSK